MTRCENPGCHQHATEFWRAKRGLLYVCLHCWMYFNNTYRYEGYEPARSLTATQDYRPTPTRVPNA